jgi:hypothetical protein
MKTFKIFSIAFMALVISLNSVGQTPNDVLKKDIPITYFGIDFSKSKAIFINCSTSEMKNKYFDAINVLIVKEKKKYDIGEILNKTNIEYNLDVVKKSNATLDTNSFQILSNKEIKPFDNNTISDIIKSYDLTAKSGVGLVFINESLDKPNFLATYYMVFFSMPDGKIIVVYKVKGTPGGFGIRNFWAGSFHSALVNDIQNLVEYNSAK